MPAAGSDKRGHAWQTGVQSTCAVAGGCASKDGMMGLAAGGHGTANKAGASTWLPQPSCQP